MSNKENVQSWRKRTKERLTKAFGSECGICSYNKSIEAMQFHHLKPTQKEFTISSATSKIRSWVRIVEEVKKCVMLCANCHSEVHSGMTSIPNNIKQFDEEYTKYKKEDFGELGECPVCKTLKPSYQQTCSRKCGAINKGKVDWENINLPELLFGKSILSVAKQLGVSDAAVHKRMRKLGITKENLMAPNLRIELN